MKKIFLSLFIILFLSSPIIVLAGEATCECTYKNPKNNTTISTTNVIITTGNCDNLMDEINDVICPVGNNDCDKIVNCVYKPDYYETIKCECEIWENKEPGEAKLLATIFPDIQKLTTNSTEGACNKKAIELDNANKTTRNYCKAYVPATTKIEDDFKLKAPTLQVRIPGFEGFSDPPTMMDDSGRAYFPWVGEYIRAIYNFGLITISILAVLMIIISGIKIIFSGLGGDRKEAYKRITQSVIGLVIAWGSYTLLYMLNPQMVNLKSLGVVLIEAITIDTEGAKESTPPVKPYITKDDIFSSSGTVNEKCKLDKYPIYFKGQEKFGTSVGVCLGWVKRSLMDACGGIPSITQKSGAWDVAAAFKSAEKFHPCDLKDIKNGDLVFMTSLGSNWIGLWENFRIGSNGCTIADASKTPVTVIDKKGNTKSTTAISGSPQGMPPVTHIGVYYDGKIYHQIGPVVEDNSITKKLINANRDAVKPFWKEKGIKLTGEFVHNGSEFIAGYGSW